MAVKGSGVAAIAIGVLFTWSGIKGWSVLGTIRDVISGKTPSQVNIYPLNAPTTGAIAGGDVAAIGMQYIGHPYLFGGAPGKDGSQPWDCSSFTNWCVSRSGRAIPGYAAGKYDGSTHGPATGEWLVWPGLTTIQASEVRAGDIVVWAGHMGIATDNTHVVNALGRNYGTVVSEIAKIGKGPVLRYGRLN